MHYEGCARNKLSHYYTCGEGGLRRCHTTEADRGLAQTAAWPADPRPTPGVATLAAKKKSRSIWA